MFKILIIFTFILLRACWECPDHKNSGYRFNVNLTLEDKPSFASHGYQTALNLENNTVFSTSMWSNLLILPLSLNHANSTFIIYGDSIADTLIISGYKVQAEMYDECGYQLRIKDPPYISHHTFTSVKSNLNSTGYTFYVEALP